MYIRNIATNHYNELLNEHIKKVFINGKGDRYALHLRYTSLQAYWLLFENIQALYLPLLNNIHQGGTNALKALKTP